MKTTENISLAGYAFTVEADAYEELKGYLNEIREVFKDDANVDEIASDIEERIAELLREKCMNGMVVNMKMVQEVKTRIGNPKELVQDDSETQQHAGKEPEKEAERQTRKNVTSRKLYRNIDERVFGGVCSGLGLYLGIDKVLIRLIFLLLFVIGFAEDGFFCISMVSYVCLWIAMPAARTVEQKREMKGRPVRLDSYKSKDFDINKEVKEVVESPGGQTIMRVMGVIIGSIFVIIGISGLIGCIIIPSMSTVISTFVTERIAGGLLAEEALIASKICSSTTFWALVLVMIGIMCVSFIYSGIMMLFNLKSPSWKPELVLFIAWLISICVIAAWTLKTVAEVLPTFLV